MLLSIFLRTLVVLAAHGCVVCTVSEPQTPLHIGGLLPLSEKDGWSRFFGHGFLVGVQLAIQDINNRSDVLANYTLVLHVTDTEGDTSVALDNLYKMLYNPPVKVAIMGSVLSSVSEVLGQVVGRWSIIEMTSSSTSVLTDRIKYPHIYRMLTSAAGFSSAYIKLLRLFGWNKIATLHQTKQPHVGIMNELQKLVSASNYTIIGTESFYKDPYEAIERLKNKGVRIIVSSFYEEMVLKVFCSIHKLGMYGPDYVWIIPGYFSEGWWDTESDLDCSPGELKLASEGYLTITYSMHGISEDVGLCGKTPPEFRTEIADEVGYQISVTDRGIAALGYDGMWSLALAMEEAEGVLSRSLDSFQYGDEEYASAVGKSILGLGFAGMSGPVQFLETGDRIGKLLIEQHIDGREVVVGIYDSIIDRITWLIPTEDLWYYSGGKPPFDSDITKTIEILQGTPVALVVAMSVLAAMGMVLAVMFVVFNIWKRKHRQVKMSSPKVNNIIACGIILAYLSVVLLGIDRTMVKENVLLAICRMRSWIIPIAFTLAFGGMFTKMWRVYSIVIANKTKRKVIKDYYLFGIIAVLLLVDFAILIPWQIIDPINIKENRVPIIQTEQDLENHVRRQLLYVICTSNNDTIWTMAMIIYKAFVVVFGAFLAWSTRNIKVSGLNDSYYVGLSVYNTVICCVVAVPLSVLNVSSGAVTFALVAGFLLLCITVSLCMLFFPKLIAVYRKNAVENETFTGTQNETIVRGPRASGVDGHEIATTSAVAESKTSDKP